MIKVTSEAVDKILEPIIDDHQEDATNGYKKINKDFVDVILSLESNPTGSLCLRREKNLICCVVFFLFDKMIQVICCLSRLESWSFMLHNLLSISDQLTYEGVSVWVWQEDLFQYERGSISVWVSICFFSVWVLKIVLVVLNKSRHEYSFYTSWVSIWVSRNIHTSVFFENLFILMLFYTLLIINNN